MKIAIDVGHARASGASANGLEEHELASALARLLADYLNSDGSHRAVIVDFPELSNSSDLAATVRHINAHDYDLVVSLHFDYSDNPSARGAHVIYTSERGREFAARVAAKLCPILPGRANQIVRRSNLYILNKTTCPAILVECGFLSSPHDAAFLRSDLYRVARAIAAALK